MEKLTIGFVMVACLLLLVHQRNKRYLDKLHSRYLTGVYLSMSEISTLKRNDLI